MNKRKLYKSVADLACVPISEVARYARREKLKNYPENADKITKSLFVIAVKTGVTELLF